MYFSSGVPRSLLVNARSVDVGLALGAWLLCSAGRWRVIARAIVVPLIVLIG